MTETEVRELRNRVFMHEVSDWEWQICRANWMKPEGIEWLKEHDFPLTACVYDRS